MPYRTEGTALDAPVSILLVTSRETRRWVIPKGNPADGLALHAGAALEAEEEAGVLGSVCPTPIGSYRYRKTRKNGAQLMFEVQVYPFAVTEELDDWAERGQRDRRWFSLKDAAEAVDEPDLKALIRGFRPNDISLAERQNPILAPLAASKEGLSMFRWFQALLPKQSNFFNMFEAHAVTLVAGSNALARLLQGGSGMNDHIQEIIEREHEADEITRHVLQSVRRTFITPFDRSAITSLIGAMDDAIDQMQQTAGAISLYEVTEFDQEMKDLAAFIVDAARLIAEAIPLLRDISANAQRLHELTERLVKLEGQADTVHAAGLKAQFKKNGAGETLRFIVNREIYTHLERVMDRFEDVANEIDGLVIDHA